jgi:hypothetical protein
LLFFVFNSVSFAVTMPLFAYADADAADRS